MLENITFEHKKLKNEKEQVKQKTRKKDTMLNRDIDVVKTSNLKLLNCKSLIAVFLMLAIGSLAAMFLYFDSDLFNLKGSVGSSRKLNGNQEPSTSQPILYTLRPTTEPIKTNEYFNVTVVFPLSEYKFFKLNATMNKVIKTYNYDNNRKKETIILWKPEEDEWRCKCGDMEIPHHLANCINENQEIDIVRLYEGPIRTLTFNKTDLSVKMDIFSGKYGKLNSMYGLKNARKCTTQNRTITHQDYIITCKKGVIFGKTYYST